MDRTFRIEELLEDAGWLRRLAAHLVGDAEADDVVQDTWLAALRRPPRAGEMRPWLRRVLANRAKNAGRDRARREARELDARSEPASAQPDEIAHAAEAQRLLAAAVARLDEPLRAVVVLRYYQGLESPEVGARLGITGSAVRTRLQRALEALRTDLDGRVEGGRESWAALLVPLARDQGGAAVGVGTAGALAGWLGWPALVGVAAACAIALAGALRWSVEGGLPGDGVARESTVAIVQAPANDASAAEDAPRMIPGAAAGDRAPSATSTAPVDVELAVASTESPGATVSGIVRVDGRVPEWPVQISLGPVLREGPVLRKNVLPRKSEAPRQLTIDPSSGGAFEFDDVPHGWRGRVVASGSLFGIAEASVRVAAPVSGVVIDLSSDPAIVGRLLDSGGRPASGVEGSFRLWGVTGDGHRNSLDLRRFKTRADGAFRLGCAQPWRGAGQVLVFVQDGRAGYLKHETTPFSLAEGLDVGELRLEPVRALTFTVRDPSGAPIEGAHARVCASSCTPVDGAHAKGCGSSFTRSAALTGRDGRGVVEGVPDAVVDVRFTALGYDEQIVRAAPFDSPEVVLRPLTRLDIQLVGSTAERATFLRVSSPTEAFGWWKPDACPEGARFQLELGGLKPSDRYFPSETGDGFEYEFVILPGVELTLVGAEPHVVLTLDLIDAVQQEVLDTAAITLVEGQRASLVLGREDGGGPPPKQTATLPVLERRSR